jgi:hypothetical protein
MPDTAATDAVRELAVDLRSLIERMESQQWPRWLSVSQAARYASLGEKSIRNLIAAAVIVPSRTVRGKLLIDRMQLDAALLSGCGRELRSGRGMRSRD